jgi:cyclopropane fatty-acyl-phospholipid synthase-like methyltransferase
MLDERALQLEYHREADAEHLAWQTEGPYFAETEARLVEGVRVGDGERLLEIGCGEGANLHHLRDVAAARFGIDFSFARSRAASPKRRSSTCRRRWHRGFARSICRLNSYAGHSNWAQRRTCSKPSGR